LGGDRAAWGEGDGRVMDVVGVHCGLEKCRFRNGTDHM